MNFTDAIKGREDDIVACLNRAVEYLVHGKGRLDSVLSDHNFNIHGQHTTATVTLLQDGTVAVTQDQDEAQGLFVLGIAYCDEKMQYGTDLRQFPVSGPDGPEFFIELSLPPYLPSTVVAAIVNEMEKHA